MRSPSSPTKPASSPFDDPAPSSPTGGTTASAWIGRTFLHPAFDYLAIGGGLSLVVAAALYWSIDVDQSLAPLTSLGMLSVVLLLCNSAHFASSTVRLYTKPGATESWPFLTLAFPLVALGVMLLCLVGPGLPYHLQALYLTWSPFHYAAQAYGLAVMYCYRSGCLISQQDKRLLRFVALLPFFYALINSSQSGLDWILPPSVLALPWLASLLDASTVLLRVLAFASPLALIWKVNRTAARPIPLISVLLLITNGVWWFVLPALEAFLWATIFHAVQYLAIVAIFHAKDHTAVPGNRHGALYHVGWFYALCLLLAYALFSCLPQAFVLLGFSLSDSLVVVIAAINLHHFIVDGFIWRQGSTDSNRKIIDSLSPELQPA